MLGVFIYHSTTMIAWFIDASYIITTVATFYWLYKICFKSRFTDFWTSILPAFLFSATYIGLIFAAQALLPQSVATILKYALTTIFALVSVIKIKKLFSSTK